MIDAHCHLIPAIDDGAKDFEMALSMARLAADAGTTLLFCTPHHLNGVFDNPRAVILERLEQLQQCLADAGIKLTLAAGSELHLTPELPGQVLDGHALTYVDRGQAALVELPKRTVPLGADDILEQLLYRGIIPIIAHPERNSELIRNPERLAEWVDWGCKLQLTAQSCAGDFGKPIQEASRDWCQRGWVHIVASDAHRPQGRSPDMRSGFATLAQWLGRDAATILTEHNPRRLFEGEPLQSIAPLKPPKAKHQFNPSWLRRWLTG